MRINITFLLQIYANLSDVLSLKVSVTDFWWFLSISLCVFSVFLLSALSPVVRATRGGGSPAAKCILGMRITYTATTGHPTARGHLLRATKRADYLRALQARCTAGEWASGDL